MYDLIEAMSFGKTFTYKGDQWIRVAGCGNPDYVLAVPISATFPAVVHIVPWPKATEGTQKSTMQAPADK